MSDEDAAKKHSDGQWLTNWRVGAIFSALTGGCVIQLVSKQDGMSSMMREEKRMARDFAIMFGRNFDEYFKVFEYHQTDPLDVLQTAISTFVQKKLLPVFDLAHSEASH